MIRIILVTAVIGTCFAYSEILKLKKNESEVYCGPMFKDLSPCSQIDYYITDHDSKDYLEDCLLRKRSLGRTVSLPPKNDFYMDPNYDKRNFRSDFIIFIPDLNVNLFDQTIHKFYNSQHQIKIYVITTTRNATFACNNGVFRKDIFNDIEGFLNIIWHRYEMYYIIGEFPYVCPGYTVIFDGKKPSGLRLYDRTMISTPSQPAHELRAKFLRDRKKLSINYPLRANIFLRFSTSINDCDDMHYYWTTKDESMTKGWCGMDVMVMHDILRHFKFKVDFPNVDDEGYGYVNTHTGSVTGSLGYMLQDVIDISFNSRFIVKYLDTDAIQFLHYVSTDSVCVVLQSPAEIPLWFYAFNVYRPTAWLCLLLTFGVAGLAAKYILLWRKKALDDNRRYKHNLVVVFIALGFTGSYLNKRIPPSILGGICLLMSLTVMSYYQGYVNYMYTNRLRYQKLQKLDDLMDSKIPIYTSQSMLDTLGKVKNRGQFVIENVNKSNLRSYGNIGMLQREADMRLEIIRNFSDDAGRPYYYIVDECFSNYFLSYYARKDFPLASDVHGYMLLLLESGLPDAYYRWTQNSLHLTTTPEKLVKPGTELRPFTPSVLNEHYVPFGILFAGQMVSTVVFLVERWWASRKRRIAIKS